MTELCPIHKEPLDPETGECPMCATLGKPEIAAEAPPPAPAVPIVRIERQEAPAPPAPPPPPPESAESKALRTEEEIFFPKLKQVRDDEHFVILFFGFETAGKTWLLHRIKKELFSHGVVSEPPFQAVSSKRGQRTQLPGTNKMEFHTIMEPDSTYVLIDVPGERTERLVDAEYSEMRMLLAAMNEADAIIVTLPADVAVFGSHFPSNNDAILAAAAQPIDGAPPPPPPAPARGKKAAAAATPDALNEDDIIEWADEFRDDNDKLQAFARGVFRVAGVLSYLRHNKIDPTDKEAFEQVTADKVEAHMARPKERVPVGGRSGLDCPTYFTLTKADRLLSLFFRDDGKDPMIAARNADIRSWMESRVFAGLVRNANLNMVDHLPLRDPWQTLLNMNRDLHAQILQFFPLAKFDYAAAFYGHPRGEISLSHDHYSQHPQRGVDQVLAWIGEAQQLRSRHKWRRAHYVWAARARRYISGIKKRKGSNFTRRKDR